MLRMQELSLSMPEPLLSLSMLIWDIHPEAAVTRLGLAVLIPRLAHGLNCAPPKKIDILYWLYVFILFLLYFSYIIFCLAFFFSLDLSTFVSDGCCVALDVVSPLLRSISIFCQGAVITAMFPSPWNLAHFIVEIDWPPIACTIACSSCMLLTGVSLPRSILGHWAMNYLLSSFTR